METVLFWLAAVIAVVGLGVAGRFLALAWSDFRLKERRTDADRRRRTIPVPMERRRRSRRS